LVEFDNSSNVELVNFMGGDNQVAMSAWVSYGNDKESRLKDQGRVAGLINFLMREQHMTPFESSVFTFRVDTPIFVAREFFRHRSASYSEISGRYTRLSPRFYVPGPERPLVQVGKAGAYQFTEGSYAQHKLVEGQLRRIADEAYRAYERMVADGVAKEVARNVLPLSIYTQFYVTMNARNLMHFLGLRTAPDALFEIREVSFQMENFFKEAMPITYRAWKQNGGASSEN
jgi:thymidylate synthase (FAD)